jgi:hypothetical protein
MDHVSFSQAISSARAIDAQKGEQARWQDIADKLGVSYMQVWRYVNERTTPRGTMEVIVREALHRHWNITVMQREGETS